MKKLIAVALGVVLLAGCTPTAEVSPPVVEPTRIATSTPEPLVRPALDELVMFPGGIDYITVGEPVEERDEDVAIIRFNPALCSDSGSTVVGWESAYGLDTFYIVTNEDETIRGIMVVSDKIRTPEGVHSGSSVDDITAAYGSSVTHTEAGATDLYSVTGDDGMLVFEVATGSDPEITEPAGTVLWTIVVGPGTQPFSLNRTAYNSCH